MGSSASRQHTGGDETETIVNPTTIQDTSSGFHVLEIHAPTAAKGGLMLLLIAAAGIIIWRCAKKRCSPSYCLGDKHGPQEMDPAIQEYREELAQERERRRVEQRRAIALQNAAMRKARREELELLPRGAAAEEV